MPALDYYDPAQLDDADYDEMSVGERRAAEEMMRRRDGEAGITRRDDREIYYDMSDEEDVSDASNIKQMLNCMCNDPSKPSLYNMLYSTVLFRIGSKEKTSCC